MKQTAYLNTPIGTLAVSATEESVTDIGFRDHSPDTADESPGPVLSQALRQLREYFAGHRTEFTIPVHLRGTPFQQAVWKALSGIPYRQTRTYGQIAAQIGRPKAVRAVGGACRANPVPVLVPCHRILGAGGGLTGYAGPHNTELKSILLALEGRNLPSREK